MKTKQLLLTVFTGFICTTATIKAKAQITDLSGFTTAPAAAYCQGDQVKLGATSAGATSYVWKRYTGSNTSGAATTLAETSANLTDTPPAGAGYFTYVSSGINAQGCPSVDSDPIVVYVLPTITASITSSDAAIVQYCKTSVPASLVLTATGGKVESVPETFGYKYQWYKGATAISGATGATYTLNATDDAVVGNMSYTVKITYALKNCTEVASNAISFNVIDLPAKPSITIIP